MPEEFPLHGPYDPTRTTDAVHLIDALVRYLIYATRHGAAVPDPSTAYAIVGALREAAAKLPQAVRQIGHLINENAGNDAARTEEALREVGVLAARLAEKLSTAQLSLRELALSQHRAVYQLQNA